MSNPFQPKRFDFDPTVSVFRLDDNSFNPNDFTFGSVQQKLENKYSSSQPNINTKSNQDTNQYTEILAALSRIETRLTNLERRVKEML
jgi:hypothetical protein